MALNLVRAGHDVTGFDPVTEARDRAAAGGVTIAAAPEAAVPDAGIVITMLPSGRHVLDLYRGGLLRAAVQGTIFLDCSTIDVADARAAHDAAREAGMRPLDAPVSGGVTGAVAGTLTFMVGGEASVLEEARPVLESMGRTIVHCGGPGAGQAAKICNNLILGISMIGVCEAFVLAEKLGLSHDALFRVASTSSGQCWSLTSYCPVPGPVPSSPANRGYEPGFAAALMLKDLRLATQAAEAAGAETRLGRTAAALYERFVESGCAGKDFSGIIEFIRGESGT